METYTESCPVNGQPCTHDGCVETCQRSGNKLDRRTARTDAVIDAVCARFQTRSQLGIAKYGTTLAENSAEHRAKLEHILAELMDACNYIMWAIMEIEKRAGEPLSYDDMRRKEQDLTREVIRLTAELSATRQLLAVGGQILAVGGEHGAEG